MKARGLYEGKYSYGAPTLFEKYHRNLLLSNIAPRYISAGSKLLDLACNDGGVAAYFKDLGLEVSCLDISEKALALAMSRGLTNVYQGNVEEPLPFASGSFDVVFWGDNAEHLVQPLCTLLEVNRVLVPNGLLFMSAPNMGWIVNRFWYLIMGMPRRTEGHMNSPWEWEHIRFFNKRVVKRFLFEGGFTLLDFFGSDRRTVFNLLCRLSPGLFSSVFLAVARKQG